MLSNVVRGGARHVVVAYVGGYLLALAVVLGTTAPLPQDPAYHAFADTRGALGVPRFGDVVSNAALLVAGLAGLAVVRRVRAGARARGAVRGTAAPWPYVLFFAAVVLTSVGSAYYHWAPSDGRLLWDRLPLSLIAAAFPLLVLVDRVAPVRGGRPALGLWCLIAPATVVYWHLGAGGGDLRPYVLLQGWAAIGGVALVVGLRPRHSHGRWLVLAAGLYGLALVCERLDGELLAALGILSGHSLKHLWAAAAVAATGWMLARRRALDTGT